MYFDVNPHDYMTIPPPIPEHQYNDYPPRDQLKKPCIVYFDGRKYKAIPLYILLKYYIVYDKYYEDDIEYDITISLCPFSLSSVVYFGKWTVHENKSNNNIILELDDTLIQQIDGTLLSSENNMYVRKNETKIMLTHNVLIKYTDPLFFHFFQKEKYKYKLSNQIIYGIIYSSSKSDETKYTAIVGKNSLDYDFNGYDIYFHKMASKIREKGGFVVPCYVNEWINRYPKSKIINL